MIRPDVTDGILGIGGVAVTHQNGFSAHRRILVQVEVDTSFRAHIEKFIVYARPLFTLEITANGRSQIHLPNIRLLLAERIAFSFDMDVEVSVILVCGIWTSSIEREKVMQRCIQVLCRIHGMRIHLLLGIIQNLAPHRTTLFGTDGFVTLIEWGKRNVKIRDGLACLLVGRTVDINTGLWCIIIGG